MRLVIVCGLSNAKLRSKLAPLLALEAVEEIVLVRRDPLDELGVRNYCPPRLLRRILPLAEIYRLLTVFWLCLRSPRPDRLVAFYLVPHGLYVGLIGWLLRIKTMQLLLGEDLGSMLASFCLESRAGFHTCLQRGGYGKPPYGVSRQELASFCLESRAGFHTCLQRGGYGKPPYGVSRQELASRLLLAIVRRAHRIGVRGENSAKRLVAQGIAPERIFVPPNVFDVETFVSNTSVEQPDFDLIYVGSLVSTKRLDVLFHVMAQLRHRHPKIRLALVGNGPLRSTLETLAVELGIRSNVAFLGLVRSEEVPCYLNKARLFVMTSRIEGLPMAMIEALSCGLPVIVPDVGDVTTVACHGENAWIVSPSTVDNFAEAISTLLEDTGLYARLREGALDSRERFRNEYSLATATEVWARALGIRIRSSEQLPKESISYDF